MLSPNDKDAMTLAIMLAMHAKDAKKQEHAGVVQFGMYAFNDCMEHTAAAFVKVLDHKWTAREAFDWLTDYAMRLEWHLAALDNEQEVE